MLEDLLAQVRAAPQMAGADLAGEVSATTRYTVEPAAGTVRAGAAGR